MSASLRVTAAIILDNQQVLIAQRHSGDDMGEKWEFPGGKIEAGESPEACLRRELHEELHVRTEVHEQFAVIHHSYPQFEIELLVYHCTIRSGDLSLHVHQDYRWAPLAELGDFDFLDADKPIVAMLQESP
ncbi:MAG: 8-oxo-dGTP diphosphatase MutT [bacterium]|nr:8-oxo-dGTP diphosphatase MutT [bacterium]